MPRPRWLGTNVNITIRHIIGMGVLLGLGIVVLYIAAKKVMK